MKGKEIFYAVKQDLSRAPLREYLQHGYEEMCDFERALRKLMKRWKDRVGERIGERHGFFLLRFWDTPGGKPDEAWLPRYILKQITSPKTKKKTKKEMEMDDAFEFE